MWPFLWGEDKRGSVSHLNDKSPLIMQAVMNEFWNVLVTNLRTISCVFIHWTQQQAFNVWLKVSVCVFAYIVYTHRDIKLCMIFFQSPWTAEAPNCCGILLGKDLWGIQYIKTNQSSQSENIKWLINDNYQQGQKLEQREILTVLAQWGALPHSFTLEGEISSLY